MDQTTYTKVGDSWHAGSADNLSSKIQREKDYFEIIGKVAPTVKTYNNTKRQSVGNEKVEIDLYDLIEILKDENIVVTEISDAYEEGKRRGKKDGFKKGVVVTYKKITNSVKKAIVIAGIALGIGASIGGVKHFQKVQDLYSHEAIMDVADVTKDSTYIVNNSGEYAYHYGDITQAIKENYENGVDWEVSLFGAYRGGVKDYLGPNSARTDGFIRVFNGINELTGYSDVYEYFEDIGCLDEKAGEIVLDFSKYEKYMQNKLESMKINNDQTSLGGK